ncbi:hypothetical protein, partial [Leucobacter sp. M11]|uniref:hypothetical protein n=1 Tax=Leucobacter sp. M11 TaxID=2993565 RepID=UPI002D8020D5
TLPVLTQASPAEAVVTAGAGFILPNPYRMSNVGAYRAPDGTLVYCLEWGKQTPSLASDPAQKRSVVGSYRGWSDAEVAKVGWLITEHGQTEDPVIAASVAVAIWLRHPGTIDPFTGENEFFVQAIGDNALRAKILAEGRRLGTLMDAALSDAPKPGGSVRVSEPRPVAAETETEADAPADTGLGGPQRYEGTVSVTGLPRGASGTVRLGEGAAFAAEGTDSVPAEPSAAVRAITGNAELRYVAEPIDADLGELRIRAEGEFTLPGGRAGASIVLWRSGGEFQDMAGAGERTREQRFTLRGSAATELRFAPELTTAVPSRVVAAGERLRDRVRAELAEGSRPWRRLSDGTYLPVTAECSLYGPTRDAPEPRDEVPEDATLASGPVRLTLGGGTADPGAEPVEIDFPEPLGEAGFYTAVCGIDAERQDLAASAEAVPAGYRFVDRYGLPNETQLRPMALRFRTELSEQTARPGAVVEDVIDAEVRNIGAAGGRLRVGGEEAPIRLRGTAYWSETRPEQQPEPPADAEPIADLESSLLPGHSRTSAKLTLPERSGWVTVRWCTDPEGTDPAEPGLVEPWCDDYGVPAETVALVAEPEPPAPAPKPEGAPDARGPLAQTGGPGRGSGALLGVALATAAAGAGILPLSLRKHRRDGAVKR